CAKVSYGRSLYW
nr:immunoglobulin heavy chain junction region [Macaca mulatta]MOY30138.1 immunoglobulin heavy chain junction region [Macaca mulatta]